MLPKSISRFAGVCFLLWAVAMLLLASNCLAQTTTAVVLPEYELQQLRETSKRLRAENATLSAQLSRKQDSLTRCRAVLKETRTTGEKRFADYEHRISVLDKQCDERQQESANLYRQGIAAEKAKTAALAEQLRGYDALKAERDKLRGKTVVGRVLRKVRNVAGSVTVGVVAVGTAILILTR